jgi:Ring finger domain
VRWKSTQEQIDGHPKVLVQFEHELKKATHGLTRCVICLDQFAVGELLKQLPCNHCFHSACISQWLAERSTCPICQQCTNAKQARGRAYAAKQ